MEQAVSKVGVRNGLVEPDAEIGNGKFGSFDAAEEFSVEGEFGPEAGDIGEGIGVPFSDILIEGIDGVDPGLDLRDLSGGEEVGHHVVGGPDQLIAGDRPEVLNVEGFTDISEDDVTGGASGFSKEGGIVDGKDEADTQVADPDAFKSEAVDGFFGGKQVVDPAGRGGLGGKKEG